MLTNSADEPSSSSSFYTTPCGATRTLEASSAAIVLDRRFTAAGNGKKHSMSAASSKMAARIRYQDFLPDLSKFPVASRSSSSSSSHVVTELSSHQESFQQLLSKANEWLRKNTSVHVKVCETVTWLSYDPAHLNDSEQMVMTKKISPNSTTYFCRGLRLWLVPRTVRRAVTLVYKDFVPEKQTDNVQQLIAKANKKFTGALHSKGQILTIETVAVPIVSSHRQLHQEHGLTGSSIIGRLDSSITQWTECGDNDAPYAFIIRVFYAKDARSSSSSSASSSSSSYRYNNTLGHRMNTHDLVPRQKDDGGYEGYEDLIDRANVWLKDNSDVIVTNMQSLTVQQNNGGPHSETGSACYYTMPGINSEHPVEFFRILRLAYVQPSGVNTYQQRIDLPPIAPVSFQTIAPELLRAKDPGITGGGVGGGAGGAGVVCRMERMRETMSKGLAHLRASGSEMICAETVLNPMQFYTIDPCSSNYSTEQEQELQQHDDEISFLLTIRLFLTNQVSGFDADTKRSSIVSATECNKGEGRNSSPSNEHPGPIFLRNVVSRRYKYRWMAVGIFAVTCMTIIVILSVIYSNR